MSTPATHRPTDALRSLLCALTLPVLVGGCAPDADSPAAGTESADAPVMSSGAPSPLASRCAPDDGGLTLPDGFCAIVASEGVGRARHIDVRDNGDAFVALAASRRDGGDPTSVVALRDTDSDGVFDVEERFGDVGGNEVLFEGDALYFAPDDRVVRYTVPLGSLTPTAGPEVVVTGLPDTRSHTAKSVALGQGGALYVNIGSPSNVCSQGGRGEPRVQPDPCPELETRAGIWRFDAHTTGQTQEDGTRFATGVRNAVALAVHPTTGQLYAAQHGRDQLQSFEDMYSLEDGAELPSEEFLAVDEGDDFGWPYCYHDWRKDRKVLAPEYGGDGDTAGRCADAEDPLVAFPGHWAPNDIEFYTGDAFPGRYHDGAFLAFHGSWNRAPLPQEGFKVAFMPFEDGRPTGEYEIFADGFRPPEDERTQENNARPVGLAVGPDGSLYVTDSLNGKIWRIVYSGG